MKANTKRFFGILLAWTLAILCAAAIFWLSSQSGEESAALSSHTMLPFVWIMERLFGENGHTVFRKFAHFFAYNALMFLTYHALFRTRKRHRLAFLPPLSACVLYAVSDEIHQYFVPDRACRIFDVGVDTLGCLTGGLCFWLLVRLILYLKKRFSERRGNTK